MSSELWAALLGALVGGLLSGLATWLTSRHEWRRQTHEAALTEIRRRVSELYEIANRAALMWLLSDSSPLQRSEVFTEFRGRYFMLEAVSKLEQPGLSAALEAMWWKSFTAAHTSQDYAKVLRLLQEYSSDPQRMEANATPDAAGYVARLQPVPISS